MFVRGLRMMEDLWDKDRNVPKSLEFGLSPNELPEIDNLWSHMIQEFSSALARNMTAPILGEWIGGFVTDLDADPAFVIQAGRAWLPTNISMADCLRLIPRSTLYIL
ncbi:hypothetical protein KC19_VG070000 [Ceratodon purpureus]|uniref:Uncharacterized protein n=1 Tax=Ceratodon purpureus TaxID=3225 RepID=A0A8T0HML1_CERPU|nr:hypothetical protein KC19_VG070000 [Ceratodon purpureus]